MFGHDFPEVQEEKDPAVSWRGNLPDMNDIIMINKE